MGTKLLVRFFLDNYHNIVPEKKKMIYGYLGDDVTHQFCNLVTSFTVHYNGRFLRRQK
jgi:hypothetical protein